MVIKICKTCGVEFSRKDCPQILFNSYMKARVNCFTCSPYLTLEDRIKKKTLLVEKQCNICKVILPKSAFYVDKNGVTYSACTKCQTAKKVPLRKKRKAKTKQHIVNLSGGKCTKCGYFKNLTSLDFHHLDPLKKEAQLTTLTFGAKSLASELDKCVLLCSNCHREHHNSLPNLGHFYNYLNEEFLREVW